MKQSHLFTKSTKEIPADEQAKNAQLLLQAGFIHKEMAGVYAFLPLGKRVLDKIAQIVREEMNAIGGQEVQMTALQPKELWEKTNRWDDTLVDNWFKTKLANGTELGVGLTHEEPIVNSLKNFISSYKDLPLYIYQIQTKFRNELRAKSGLMRGREFIMKDMYSFAHTQEEHDDLYEKAAQAYARVYTRLGIGHITYRTYADGGIFTQKFSDEFQTVSPIGEDTIYVDLEKQVAVNKEIYNDKNLEKLGLKKEDLVEKRGVEVGNIFPLESKYTDALDVYYTDEQGNRQSIIMGCYGIGVSRLVGLIAEHFSDEKGLSWPKAVAPFHVHLITLSGKTEKDEKEIQETAERVMHDLEEAGVEVLWDDRMGITAGVKFADADLYGIPLRIVLSPRTIAEGGAEWKERTQENARIIPFTELIEQVKDWLVRS